MKTESLMTSQVCWPVNTLIQPGSNYSLELQAEASVLQALSWDVTNSSLQLSTNGSFRSLYPIVAIVRVFCVLGPSYSHWVACYHCDLR